MSTTIKRIALVAVAALTLGVVSVAPSQAAGNDNLWCKVADGVSAGTASTDGNNACGAVAGPYNSMTLEYTQFGAGDVIELTGGTFVSASNATLNTAKTAAVTSANGTLVVATPAVGTITAKIYKNTAGVVATTASETVTITVATAALSGTYSAAKSPIYLVAGETFTATADATTTPSKVKTYVATDSATASIVVYSKDGLGAAVVNDTYTATIISGPGTILTSVVTATGQYDSVTAYSKQSQDAIASYSAKGRPDSSGRIAFFVYANGQPGDSVITIRNSAGTVLSTKTVKFSDTTVASITATVLKNYVQGDSTTHTPNVIKLTLKDAAGNAISSPAAYPTVKSSDSTLGTAVQNGTAGVSDTATANSSGEVFWGFDAAAAGSYGSVTLTFSVGTASTTATVTLSSAKASTVTVAPLELNAGAAVDYVVTLKDAKGNAIPDGLAFDTYVSAIATTGGIATAITAPSSSIKSVNGTFTTTGGVAPLVSTDLSTTFTLTGTAGTADAQYVSTLAGTKVYGAAKVSNASIDAATDAANEATAAANDATDAAILAADAAEAATTAAQNAVDAVAELSAKVDGLIKNLNTQITQLRNLLIKIQKKVKA